MKEGEIMLYGLSCELNVGWVARDGFYLVYSLHFSQDPLNIEFVVELKEFLLRKDLTFFFVRFRKYVNYILIFFCAI
jgi:hypothetical protein